jgi:hypothetical protein
MEPVLASSSPSKGFPDPLPQVRRTVRSLLVSAPAFAELDPERRRALASAMVRVCHAAALLLREELESDRAARGASDADGSPLAQAQAADAPVAGGRTAVAATQATAGQVYSGVSAGRVAATTEAILNAVSFPRFVTDLITGVFKAVVDSSVQQMNAYVELLNNVAATTEGFADANVGPDRARAWLAERYPASFEVGQEESDDEDQPGAATLRLRGGAAMPTPAALRTDLGLSDDEPIPTGDPERTLVPLVRGQLAKKRQETLATMVRLGMQRIVIDSGRITAAMRFHIDTRSAAEVDEGSRTDLRHTGAASVSFGVGAWGFSGAASHSIGYVSTQKTQTTEEMGTDLDLNSSVEVNFRSDYLPLNRMTTSEQAARIQANTINPAEEAKAAATAAATRRTESAKTDQIRRDKMDALLKSPEPTPPKPGDPGTTDASKLALEEGKRREKEEKEKKEKEDAAKSKPESKPESATPPVKPVEAKPSK